MKRLLLDAVLFVLLLYLMAFRLLPRRPHEAIGVLFPLLTILHLVWNRAWFSSFSRDKWDFARLFPVLVNFGLIASFLAATVSGLAVAHRLFPGVFGPVWQKSLFVRQLHIASGYWMMVLTGLHLGLHWQSLWTRFLHRCGWDGSRRGCPVVGRAAAFVIAAGGIYGSFLNRMGDRLMMVELIRQTPATRLPTGLFILVLLLIFGFWTVIGYAAGSKGKSLQ